MLARVAKCKENSIFGVGQGSRQTKDSWKRRVGSRA
jgi:hypothetical protein